MELLYLFLFFGTSFTSAQDDKCQVSERANVSLAAIHAPAYLLQILTSETTPEDCNRLCCLYKSSSGDRCNAVSYYKSGDSDLCVLLNCTPFRKCTWKVAQDFYAARIIRTSTTTMTTTTAPTITTTVATTTTLNYSFEPGGDGEDWNVVDEQTITTTPKIATTTVGPVTIITKTIVLPYNDIPFLNNTNYNDKDGGTFNSNDHDDDDDDDDDDDFYKNWEIDNKEKKIENKNKSYYDSSPPSSFSTTDQFYLVVAILAIVITMVILSVAVLKKVIRRGRHYRPLREYDVKVEPPASSASLLP